MSHEEKAIDPFEIPQGPDFVVQDLVIPKTEAPPSLAVPLVPADGSAKNETPSRHSGYGHHNNSRRGIRW